MKREHLIIIAVVIFVIAACGFGVLGAVVLWPSEPEVLVENPPNSNGTGPGQYIPPVGGGNDEMFAPAVGSWQCVQGSPNIREGSVLTFVSVQGQPSRLAYWAETANSDPVYQFECSLYPQDGFNWELQQMNAPRGQEPVKLKVLIDVLDENKMELFAFEEHRASSQPAILRRVSR